MSLYVKFFFMNSLFILLLFFTEPAFSQVKNGSLTIPLNNILALPLPEPATSVLIGNPAIANVTLEDGRLLIVGLSVGQTNLLVTGAEGGPLLARTLLVVPSSPHSVSVKKAGKPAQTFLCAPRCESLNPDPTGEGLRRAAPAPTED